MMLDSKVIKCKSQKILSLHYSKSVSDTKVIDTKEEGHKSVKGHFLVFLNSNFYCFARKHFLIESKGLIIKNTFYFTNHWLKVITIANCDFKNMSYLSADKFDLLWSILFKCTSSASSSLLRKLNF